MQFTPNILALPSMMPTISPFGQWFGGYDGEPLQMPTGRKHAHFSATTQPSDFVIPRSAAPRNLSAAQEKRISRITGNDNRGWFCGM
jgi:hypothetical protein